MGGGEEIKKEVCFGVEDAIYVAVGKNVKEGKSMLDWTVKSFPGKNICLLHVHQPTHLVSLLDTKFSANKLQQQLVKTCQELERQKMQKLLNQYLLFLSQLGVQAGKVWIEADNVEAGILQIILQQKLRWLVMGAAANKYYSKKLSDLKSRKATLVSQQAPVACHIWFICNGFLICTRSTNTDSCVNSSSRVSSPTSNGQILLLHDRKEGLEENIHRCSSPLYGTSPRKMSSTLNSSCSVKGDTRGDIPPLHSTITHLEDLACSSSFQLDNIQEEPISNVRYKLEQATIDAEDLRQRAFEESVRLWRAEKDALEAAQKAKASEGMYMEEVIRRNEIEEILIRQRKELESMKDQHEQALKELQKIKDEKPVLESRLKETRCTEEELEEKIIQAVELLITFKEKRDDLQIEHDNAIKELNRFRQLEKEGAMGFSSEQFFSCSFLDITEVTQNFDPSCRIEEGRFGCTYKGIIRQIRVSIKMLPSCGSLSDLEFKHKVELLSRVRHRNIVTLIGTCLESRSLIYEYLENGNLEDRLNCQANARPLPLHYRIGVALDICSALVFLHANKPPIVHGNLNPSNVFLDENFVGKICDLGVHLLITQNENQLNSHTLCIEDNPIGVDFIPTIESDVYSFGVLLLRLLTARPASGIVRDVKSAMENGSLETVLDSSAGDWPLDQANQLAYLAFRCCNNESLNRPDLVEVLKVLEPMRDLCTLSSLCSTSSSLEPKGQCRIPSHFVCPIFQDVMEDPCIAADGFTYEADAIKGWLNSGHKTSPMTNLKLDHCDLLPNYALYSAIQEWKQLQAWKQKS